MMKVIASSLLAAAVVGCASLGHPPPSQVEPRHVAGYYYQGDGLGTNILVELREDGTYKSTWHGCLGEYGTSQGTWGLDDGSIIFEPINETEMLVGYLRQARIKSSWPHYKLIPESGSAHPGEALYRYFPGLR
jgi:hypothetical protein